MKWELLDESMARVTANALALIVQKADISHKADPARQVGLLEASSVGLAEKYEKSALLLGTTLEAILVQRSLWAQISATRRKTREHERLPGACLNY